MVFSSILEELNILEVLSLKSVTKYNVPFFAIFIVSLLFSYLMFIAIESNYMIFLLHFLNHFD